MSFSKTFSMTGYRLGYAIVPDRYLEKATMVQGMAAARPATLVYAGGTAVGSQEFCDRLQKEGVGMRPGKVFGLNTDGYVRAALVRPIDDLKKVVAMVEKVAKSL